MCPRDRHRGQSILTSARDRLSGGSGKLKPHRGGRRWRRLPNQVAIRCWAEAALIWESGGRYWWIAADGTVLPDRRPGTMPVLHDIAGFSPNQRSIPGVPGWRTVGHLPAIQAFDYTRSGLVRHEQRVAVYPVIRGCAQKVS